MKTLMFLMMLSGCATIDIVNIKRCSDLCENYDTKIYRVGKHLIKGDICCECINGEYFWFEKREVELYDGV